MEDRVSIIFILGRVTGRIEIAISAIDLRVNNFGRNS